jgi:hypothetical protein
MAHTSATQWKKKSYTELSLPSGNRCLAKRSGIEAFMRSGKVPNSLMPIMKSALAGQPRSMPAESEIDETFIDELFSLFDLVATTVMVEPKCYPIPGDDEERLADHLYVDEVEVEDKQFMFQWAVGGTADLEKFREGVAKHVAAVQEGGEVRSAP